MQFIETRSFKKIHAAFKKTVGENGWMLVSGNVGYGKTTLKDELLIRYGNRSNYKIIEMKCLHNMTINAIMRKMVRVLSSETPCSASDALIEQFTRIVGEASYQYTTVLIIDEAQDIPFHTILCMKRIHEIRFGSHEKLFTIMLIGKPELKNCLKIDEIGYRVKDIDMQPLTQDEAELIINDYPFVTAARERFLEIVKLTPLAVCKTAERLNDARQAMPGPPDKITVQMIESFMSDTLSELQIRAGASDREIAKGTGLSATTVNQIKHGIYQGDMRKNEPKIRSFLLDKISEQENALGGKARKTQ